jgi:hypothetical protein
MSNKIDRAGRRCGNSTSSRIFPMCLRCWHASSRLYSQLPASHSSIRIGFDSTHELWEVLTCDVTEVIDDQGTWHKHELRCSTSREFHKIGENGRIERSANGRIERKWADRTTAPPVSRTKTLNKKKGRVNRYCTSPNGPKGPFYVQSSDASRTIDLPGLLN